MPLNESTSTTALLAKVKDIQARALECSRQRREQGLLPLGEVPTPPPAQVAKAKRGNPVWPSAQTDS